MPGRLHRILMVLVPAGLLLLGTLSGVYIGHSMGLGRTTPMPAIRPDSFYVEIDPFYRSVFELGDRFPDERCTDSAGAEVRFRSFFDGSPVVLLFWNLDCPPCTEQARLWHIFMEPHLLGDVRQIVCLDTAFRKDIGLHSSLLQGKVLAFIEEDRFRHAFNFTVSPIIMSLDGSGIITHIQYEYSPYFDERLVRLLTNVAFEH